jgi:hypothetical protein
VAALRDDVERALRAPGGAACERPHNTLVPLRWSDAAVERVLRAEDALARLTATLDAADLRWTSGYVSVKEPFSPPLWWHQDWWCWDHPASYEEPAPQVALLTYLTRVDAGNAALRVLPGSHRASMPLHAVLPEAHADETGDLAPEHPAMADQPEQVTLALAPGDAVVMDYRLLHGTHANGTAERRDGLLLNFAPSWSSLPADLRGHLIRSPGLPGPDEARPAWAEAVLPRWDGPVADLPLSRAAPARFALSPARA